MYTVASRRDYHVTTPLGQGTVHQLVHLVQQFLLEYIIIFPDSSCTALLQHPRESCKSKTDNRWERNSNKSLEIINPRLSVVRIPWNYIKIIKVMLYNNNYLLLRFAFMWKLAE
jgi:hypothetical protein